MINVIMLAVFIEAIVSAVKPLWNDGGKCLTITEIVSMVIGMVLAIALKIDLFSALVDLDIQWDSPKWVYYIFYGMSGIAIGRGPSFLYDLWKNIKKWGGAESALSVTTEETRTETREMTHDYEDIIDLEISHWSLEMLREFCILNDINSEGCQTREDYMDAIERGASDKPPDSEQ